MLISLRPDGGEPVYDQLARGIAVQIADGTLAPGERLPAARDLAEVLGIHMHTVLHAYQRLRDEGLLELRRGRGAVVRGSAAAARIHDAVGSLVAEAKAADVPLHTLSALIRKDYDA